MTSRTDPSHGVSPAVSVIGAAALAAAVLPAPSATADAAEPSEAAATGQPASECVEMPVIGHRGYTQLTPTTEETSEAWMRAAADGVTTVEGDLHTTSDGHWVLMHDDTVDRTTDGSGAVADKTYDSLTRLRMADGQSAHVLMADLIAKVHRAHPSMEFQLELKGGVTIASAQRLGDRLRELGVAGQTTITSFEPSYLAIFRSANLGFRVGLISDEVVPTATVEKYDVVIVNGDAAGLSARYVAAVHALGRQVHVWWLGQDHDDWRRLMVLGVDGYIANDPGQARAWCDEAQTLPPSS